MPDSHLPVIQGRYVGMIQSRVYLLVKIQIIERANQYRTEPQSFRPADAAYDVAVAYAKLSQPFALDATEGDPRSWTAP